jgi:hypothetical protein
MKVNSTQIRFFAVIIALACFAFFAKGSHSNTRIGIISDVSYCGEREVALRIKIAAESLGWEVFVDEQRGRKVKKIRGLDWTICLLPNNKYYNKYCRNYVTLFHPFNYLNEQGKLDPFYERYDGYLLTIRSTESLKDLLSKKNRPFFSTPFYPTVHPVDYKLVVFNNLMTMIPVWGNRRTDDKFKQFYRMLSQGGFTQFYGVHENKDMIENGYMGSIPFDGTSVIETLQKHGIVLIFHSDIHNREAIPSSRIFEAAAASVAIISDTNEFVKNHFGDAVFYVDTSLSAEEIYQQVKRHVETIQQNPLMVLEMARKCHQIFNDRFLMTDQLMRIASMHNEVQKQRSARCKFHFGQFSLQ